MSHQAFSQQQMSDQSGQRRDAMLKEIAAAYDAYIELKGNLEEGTRVSELPLLIINFLF